MLANVGSADRTIRLVIGLLLLGAVYIWPEKDWGWLGLAPFLSGAARYCPFYALLGITTCGYR